MRWLRGSISSCSPWCVSPFNSGLKFFFPSWEYQNLRLKPVPSLDRFAEYLSFQAGTTLLMALPLGAVLCFFNLLGARAFARGEVLVHLLFQLDPTDSIHAAQPADPVPLPASIPPALSSPPNFHPHPRCSCRRSRKRGGVSWRPGSSTIILQKYLRHGKFPFLPFLSQHSHILFSHTVHGSNFISSTLLLSRHKAEHYPHLLLDAARLCRSRTRACDPCATDVACSEEAGCVAG